MTLMELNLLKAMSIYAMTMAESYSRNEEYIRPALERCQAILDRELRMKTLDPVKGTYGNTDTKEEYRNGQSSFDDSNVMPKTS